MSHDTYSFNFTSSSCIVLYFIVLIYYIAFSDFKDVYQPPQGNVFVIPDLLEDIDINSDMNIHDEPIWLKYLHVPFEPLEEEALAEDNIRGNVSDR